MEPSQAPPKTRSSPSSRRPLGRVWVDTAILHAPFGPAFTANLRSGRQWPGNLPTRMATTSSTNKPRSTTGRATHTPGSNRPSHAGLTNGTLCQQHLHNHSVGPWFDQCLTYPSHLFRLLLLRRLRLPLPLSERSCRCRRVLDPLGDHRAACPRAGVLRSRAGPLERAAARVCREAGARVTTNTALTHLNLPNLTRYDNRRIEVIANGIPIHQGAQLAVDTTLVSPLTSSGVPRRHRGQYHGAALTEVRKRKERAYPELVHTGRCRLIVLGVEVGGKVSNEAANFVRSLAHARARSAPVHLKQATIAASVSRGSAI